MIKLFKTFGAIITIGSTGTLSLVFRIPRFHLFLYWFVPLSWDGYFPTIFIRVFSGALEFYFAYMSFGCCTVFFFLFGYIAVSISYSVAKLGKIIDMKCRKVRWDFDYTHILIYKGIQILVGRINFVFNRLAFGLEIIFFCTTSIVLYGLICIENSVYEFVLFLYISGFAAALNISLFLPIATLNYQSKKLLVRFRSTTRGVLRRRVAGCLPLTFRPVGIHSISRKTVLQYILVLTNLVVFLIYYE